MKKQKDVNAITTKRNNVKTSMGKIGNCLDNHKTEYFFSSLKGKHSNHIATHNMKIVKLDLSFVQIKMKNLFFPVYNVLKLQ